MQPSLVVKLDNKEVESRLLDLAKRSENLRPLMKNIAGVFAYSTEENFKEEGRPDKWTDLAESTKKTENEDRTFPRTNFTSFRSTGIINKYIL